MTTAAPPPRAPRRDGQRTRNAIRRAATDLFARNGYEQTTVRAIAKRARCNSALINRYFGSKENLFALVSRPGDNPRTLAQVIDNVAVRHWGTALVRNQLHMSEHTGRDDFVDKLSMLLRSAGSPTGSRLLNDAMRKQLTETTRLPIAGRDIGLRTLLVYAQLFGLTLLYDVIGLRELRNAEPRDIARYLAPALQTILVPPRTTHLRTT